MLEVGAAVENKIQSRSRTGRTIQKM
uniref:Uncharacterized protein n=1 Tax=Anguilla anguilla TaxID=7936 RepID=A0A0E9VPH6_ANGAN